MKDFEVPSLSEIFPANPLFHSPVQWEKPPFPWLDCVSFPPVRAGAVITAQNISQPVKQSLIPYSSFCPRLLLPSPVSRSSAGVCTHVCPTGPIEPGWIRGMKVFFLCLKCILLTNSPVSSPLPLHFSSILWCAFLIFQFCSFLAVQSMQKSGQKSGRFGRCDFLRMVNPCVPGPGRAPQASWFSADWAGLRQSSAGAASSSAHPWSQGRESERF